ncbi:hypothetical protein HKK52_06065 [Pseudomonas sp. ADAK2]|uniref:hypothetical protein n=1 Tax=unclassified Pseudomonas TaxID=196821 RepID=UPI001463896C|nr:MULTISPECIES: hypothetical protein [unclassified Pseudomonas]QJI40498.1 hypothetical protein HKK53_06060 [Pseudomonas sp. ADAK7]QJI46803.1 hypothetical protein HKK52_06065 [Pseudomonas sp. ADAK2]
MAIDKEKLKALLWAEAASFRADCSDWKRNTEALQDFLGEKTVEEAALELLAENEALRKDAERFQYLDANPDFQIAYTGDMSLGHYIDAAMGKGEQL